VQPLLHYTVITLCNYCIPVCVGFVLSGYFQGKRNAEHAMAEAYPDQGVCLRPGFIHGTRYVSGVGIPLSLIGNAAILLLQVQAASCAHAPGLCRFDD